jgi:GDP-mannose transporter
MRTAGLTQHQQSIVCVGVIQILKVMGFAKFRDFNTDEARKWFPISLLLIGMIYSGSKALQYLSIPVYTIFKNMAIILIAYGEVLWFGGSVTSMTLLSFGLMVFSSIVAAWADISNALSGTLDDDQLLLRRRLRARHAQAHQAHKLQGL